MTDQRKIILHAGFPKTGTTFLQSALFSNRDKFLRDRKILIPGATANLSDALCTLFHDDPMVHITNRIKQYSFYEIEKLKAEYRQQLEDDLRRPNWETAILSAEGLANLQPHELARVKEWGGQFAGEWTVVYYVRSTIDWVRSVSQEIAKGGKVLEQLYDSLPLPHYKGRLENAIWAFGRECVSVHSFEDAIGHEHGIVGDFLSAVGLPADYLAGFKAEESEENASMSAEAIQVLDRLNTLRPMFNQRGGLGNQRTGREVFTLLKVRGGRFRLPEPVENDIRNATAADEQWLQTEFGITFDDDAAERQGEAGKILLSDETASSFALIISDLLNKLREHEIYYEIQAGHQSGDLNKVRQLVREAKRLVQDH